MNTLYEDLKAAGIPTDNHESDLYFPETAASLEILRRHEVHRQNARRFVCVSDGGKPWIEVPFAYQPWWEERAQVPIVGGGTP